MNARNKILIALTIGFLIAGCNKAVDKNEKPSTVETQATRELEKHVNEEAKPSEKPSSLEKKGGSAARSKGFYEDTDLYGMKRGNYGHLSQFLQLLDSTPTPGVTDKGQFYILESHETRCTELGREIYFYTTFCRMKKEGHGPQPSPAQICERAERARKAFSLSINKEVVGFKPMEGSETDRSVGFERGLEEGIRGATMVPRSCR